MYRIGVEVEANRFQLGVRPALPAGAHLVQQVLGQAHRETRVVKDDFGLVRLLLQIESDDGIRSRLPACGTPCLDNSLVRHKLDVASRDVVTE